MRLYGSPPPGGKGTRAWIVSQDATRACPEFVASTDIAVHSTRSTVVDSGIRFEPLAIG
jgi:hypothetical protein